MRSLLILMSAALLLASCETTAGLGRDLKKGGKNIEDAAESLKL